MNFSETWFYNCRWSIFENDTFFCCSKTSDTSQIAKLYFKEIVKLYGIPKSIMSSRDVKYMSYFWKTLQMKLGTKQKFSTTYHP